jgi:hypothetical protein
MLLQIENQISTAPQGIPIFVHGHQVSVPVSPWVFTARSSTYGAFEYKTDGNKITNINYIVDLQFLPNHPSETMEIDFYQPLSIYLNNTAVVDPPTDIRKMYSGNLELWLSRAKKLEQSKDISGALDLIYRSLDQTLRDGRFREVDEFLRKLDPKQLSIDMLIAILILSRPAIDKLPSREAFYKGAWNAVESHKRNARELLGGLRRRPKGAGQSVSLISASNKRSSNRSRWNLLGWLTHWNTTPSSRGDAVSPSVRAQSFIQQGYRLIRIGNMDSAPIRSGSMSQYCRNVS